MTYWWRSLKLLAWTPSSKSYAVVSEWTQIKNSLSLYKYILPGVPQGSILGPISFNIFMNDIFFLLGSDLHNFADDNTNTAVEETIQGLINSPEVTTGNAIEWMKNNDMIADPDKLKLLCLLN